MFHYFTGTLIKRHRIPRPPPNEDEFYTAEDFNIGSEINLYSRVFKITDCDQFTQNFLRKMGTNVQRPGNPPEDPYMNYRKGVSKILKSFICLQKITNSKILIMLFNQKKFLNVFRTY